MTKQQKENLFLLLQKFLSDNMGNRINEWLAESFLNRAHIKLEEIYRADNTANNTAELRDISSSQKES